MEQSNLISLEAASRDSELVVLQVRVVVVVVFALFFAGQGSYLLCLFCLLSLCKWRLFSFFVFCFGIFLPFFFLPLVWLFARWLGRLTELVVQLSREQEPWSSPMCV